MLYFYDAVRPMYGDTPVELLNSDLEMITSRKNTALFSNIFFQSRTLSMLSVAASKVESSLR